MRSLSGFLLAQGVAFSGLYLYRWITRPKPPKPLSSPEELARYKWVMPTIRAIEEYKPRPIRFKTERIPLSKTERFAILKRDKFTCQYCGSKPPEVTLEVDHIQSVYNGGTNDPRNLITSCFTCNRGKGADSVELED